MSVEPSFTECCVFIVSRVFNPKKDGGGGGIRPPPSTFFVISQPVVIFFALKLHDFFPSNLALDLRPFF